LPQHKKAPINGNEEVVTKLDPKQVSNRRNKAIEIDLDEFSKPKQVKQRRRDGDTSPPTYLTHSSNKVKEELGKPIPIQRIESQPETNITRLGKLTDGRSTKRDHIDVWTEEHQRRWLKQPYKVQVTVVRRNISLHHHCVKLYYVGDVRIGMGKGQ
jgi:hypothetical protein